MVKLKQMIGGQDNGGVVRLDGREYSETEFTDCIIRSDGKAEAKLKNCSFDSSCRLGFGGSAFLTLEFIAHLYHEKPDLVDALLDDLKKGRFSSHVVTGKGPNGHSVEWFFT